MSVVSTGGAPTLAEDRDRDRMAAEAEAISRGAQEWLGRVERSRKPFVAAFEPALRRLEAEPALAESVDEADFARY